MMTATTTMMQWALKVDMQLGSHHEQQHVYQQLRRRAPYLYHFVLFRKNVRQATKFRKKIIRLWQNQHLRVGFAAFRRHAGVARVLLRACSYLQWHAWSAWNDYVLFDRSEEIAAYLLADEVGSVRGLKNAFRRWRRGARFFQRERDLTRISIAKYRRRCRLIAQSFHSWLDFIVRRRRARARLSSVSMLWLRHKYRGRFNRWSDVARRIGVLRRRKLRDAMALWSQATVVRCVRAWSLYCRKVRTERKQAIGRWKNQSLTRCFQAWMEMVAHAQRAKEHAKNVITAVLLGMLHRHLYTAFHSWIDAIDTMDTGVQLDPFLDQLFDHAHQDVLSHDKDTAQVRQSWLEWKNPLDNAVQEMVIETSQYGKRWVARETTTTSTTGRRANMQPSNSYREPLTEVGANAADPSTIQLDGVNPELLESYRRRYQVDYQNTFAREAAVRATIATKERKKIEAERFELHKKLEVEREKEEVVVEDSAFAYAFEYSQYLLKSTKLTKKIQAAETATATVATVVVEKYSEE